MRYKNLRIWLALSVLALSQIMCVSGDIDAIYNITVYEDTNENGQRDNGEPPLSGIKFLVGKSSRLQSTDENGYAKIEITLSSSNDCKNRSTLSVVVPQNYRVTEDNNDKSPWTCSMVGGFFVNNKQSKDFVFGLAPIPLTVDANPGLIQTAPTELPTEEPVSPSLKLTKTPKPNFYTEPGQTIIYTYIFENTGNVGISGPFTLEDDKVFKFECDQDIAALTLQPGETATCYGNYITGDGKGTIVNIAKIKAAYDGQTVEAEAQAEVYYVEPTEAPEEPEPLPTEDACEGPPYPEGCDPPPLPGP